MKRHHAGVEEMRETILANERGPSPFVRFRLSEMRRCPENAERDIAALLQVGAFIRSVLAGRVAEEEARQQQENSIAANAEPGTEDANPIDLGHRAADALAAWKDFERLY